jgi:hypothetical protein
MLNLGALARRLLLIATVTAASACSDGGSESSEVLIWIGQTPDDAAADDSDNKAWIVAEAELAAGTDPVFAPGAICGSRRSGARRHR